MITEKRDEVEPTIISIMDSKYGQYIVLAIIENEVVNKDRGNSPQECIEKVQAALGKIQVLSGNAWQAACKEARKRLEASLVRIDEENGVVVDEVLYDKHPNIGQARKVIVTRITKNFIFAKYADCFDMEPMKYRRDGSFASDEYKRCRLFKKPA